MSKRTIRRSQAIYPYGPGSIIDQGQESFVVLDTVRNRRAWNNRNQHIRLQRLESALGYEEGFRGPPLDSGVRRKSLLVMRFPTWLFCPNCRRMWKWSRSDEIEQKSKLPRCKSDNCRNNILVPMRYVAICKNGHLNDVDWHYWVHGNSKTSEGPCSRNNQNLSFITNNKFGSSMKATSIKCNNCNTSRNLENIGTYGFRCNGRQPWQRSDERETCSERVVIRMRSSTAIYFPDTVSALDIRIIQDEDDNLDEWVKNKIQPLRQVGNDQVVRNIIFENLMNQWLEEVNNEISMDVSIDAIEASVNRILMNRQEIRVIKDIDDLLEEEFEVLKESTNDDTTNTLKITESDYNDPSVITKLKNQISKIMLIERLREVRVLKGFGELILQVN